MISDILSDAVEKIKWYLENGAFNNMYTGDIRITIDKLVDHMDTVRKELDAPYGPDAGVRDA